MAKKKEIDDAIQKERERCLGLLDAYRQDFDSSSDKMMPSLWCRIRNQITLGIEPEESSFDSQMNFEEEGFDSESN